MSPHAHGSANQPSTMDQQKQPHTFFCETYRFRNWTTLAVAVGFGLPGAYAFCWGLAAIYFGGVRQQRLDAVAIGLFAVGLGIAFFYVAYRATSSWLACHTITACIDDRGITVGDEFYPYGMVCWIGGNRPFPFARKVQLVFGCDHYRETCQIIPRNKLTSMDEFQRLMHELSTTVGLEYPELTIGEVGSGMKALAPAFPKREATREHDN
jgi:hypothetical protein